MTLAASYTPTPSARGPNTMAGWTKHGYLLHIRTQRCGYCARETTYTSVNEVFVSRGGADRKLFPRCAKIEKGYPVECSKLPDEILPCCSVCYNILAQQPTAAAPLTEEQWRESVRKKWQDEKPRDTSPIPVKAHPRHPTVADL